MEETNHGGAVDSFKVSYGGADSATITSGVNYTSAGIKAAIEAIPGWPAGATATVANFGGGGAPSVNGFQVTFSGTLATTDVSSLSLTSFSAGASGWIGETDKGGAVDNKGGIITPTGNTWPTVSAPVGYTIPLRTPFALTGEATDAESDAMLFSWEQNDRGGSAGTSLLNNTKANGGLFAMFPKSGQISATDTLMYDSPGENHLTSDPTRVFPDLQQILDNNTNADTGSCPAGPIAPPVPQSITECYAEFLPTSDYVGFSGGGTNNSSPLSLHFRFTARDGKGGVNAADTTLLLDNASGPFLVTEPNTAVSYVGGSNQTVTWDVAGTDAAPVSATDVKISLSVDGGHTYPYVLADTTANDGSELVMLPNVGTAEARIKVEAVDNIFFDVSNADFTIQALSDAEKHDSVEGKGDLPISPASPAGTYAPTAGSTVDFDYKVRFKEPKNKKAPVGGMPAMDELKGDVKLKFESGGRSYELTTTSIDALGLDQLNAGGTPCPGKPSLTCFGLAELRATATLTDVTKGQKPKDQVVASGLTLVLTMTDKGDPGKDRDTLGITVWQGSTLVLSSERVGSATVEKAISKGNIRVR